MSNVPTTPPTAKQANDFLRDLLEPGWREKEAARIQPFLDLIPIRESGLVDFSKPVAP